MISQKKRDLPNAVPCPDQLLIKFPNALFRSGGITSPNARESQAKLVVQNLSIRGIVQIVFKYTILRD